MAASNSFNGMRRPYDEIELPMSSQTPFDPENIDNYVAE